MEFDPVLTGAVFLSAAAIDTVGTLDVRRTAEGKAGQAAGLTVLGLLLGALNLYVFIKEGPQYLIPEAVGAAIGTYATVKFDSRKRMTDVSKD